MTFKAKPVVKRAPRPAWEGQERRNFLLNVAFGIVVIAAVVILVMRRGLNACEGMSRRVATRP